MADHFDSPWKEAVQRYLPQFLQLCFPEVGRGIDWSREPVFLEQELREIVREAEIGDLRVDCLAQVWLMDGAEQWILLHVEIQSQPDLRLPERLYRYQTRLSDRYLRPVVTMCLLADEAETFRPGFYESAMFGCRIRFEFLTCKILDFALAELERSSNPIALVIAAQREAQMTRRDDAKRAGSKWRLIRGLYDRGLTPEDVRELFRLIDWMMKLSAERELELREQLRQFEQENHMSYVTSIERFAKEEGLAEGLEKGLEEGLERGLEKGRMEGALIGRIQAYQRVLREAQTPADILSAHSLEELNEIVLQLEARL